MSASAHALTAGCRDESALAQTPYGLPRGAILRATLRREITLMKRNQFIYIFRTAQVGPFGGHACCLVMPAAWYACEDYHPGAIEAARCTVHA